MNPKEKTKSSLNIEESKTTSGSIPRSGSSGSMIEQSPIKQPLLPSNQDGLDAQTTQQSNDQEARLPQRRCCCTRPLTWLWSKCSNCQKCCGWVYEIFVKEITRWVTEELLSRILYRESTTNRISAQSAPQQQESIDDDGDGDVGDNGEDGGD